jgi:hypothetical protein
MQKGEAKKKLEDYLDKIYTEFTDLNILLETMKYLRNINRLEQHEVINQTSPFFNYVYILILQDIVLRLDRLYEKTTIQNNNLQCGKNNTRSLYWYLEQMKIHSSSFQKPQKFSTQEINEQIEEIDSMNDKLQVIGAWRDKWFAHRQKEYFDNPDKMSKDYPLLMQDIEDLIGFAKNLINEHHSKLQQLGVNWTNDLIEINKIISFLIERNRLFVGIHKKYGYDELRELLKRERTEQEIYENNPGLRGCLNLSSDF